LESRAPTLKEGVSLAGWLFNTLRFLAKDSRRKDERRRKHEARAAELAGERAANGVDDTVWEQMSPLLEEAVATLTEADRLAVLLRFYEGQEFAHIGKELGVTEVTARKRVSRAVKKLGSFFKQKGVIVPAVVLAGMLFTRTAQAAPAEIVGTILDSAASGTGGALACTLVKQTAARFMKGRRRLAAAIVACMGLLGIGLWLLLVSFLIHSDQDESAVRLPLTDIKVEMPAPDEQLLANDDFARRSAPKQGYARFDWMPADKPEPARPQPAVTGIDALWWFREWFDLRNTPDNGQRKKETPPDEMLMDPRTGEMHPRSWFDEHVVDSFDHMGGGGGGGGAATADTRGTQTITDATPGKTASGSEHGNSFGGASTVEVVVASSSSATSSAADPALPRALTFITDRLVPVASTRTLISLTGDLSVWYSASDQSSAQVWAISETAESDYLVIQAGSGAERRFLLIRRQGSEETIAISGSSGEDRIGRTQAGVLNLGDWLKQIESGSGASEFPPGVDLNDPGLRAALDALRAKYGDFSPNQVTYGVTDEHGHFHLEAVPEPAAMLLLAGIAMILRRRRRVR
jgi:RNA polymerase sigma factor (sigma-70 family)